jgi:hypothetical protein
MPEIINAEFEIVDDPRPRPIMTWTFWEDDFPNLARIIGGVATAALLTYLFNGPLSAVRHWL